MTRKSKAQQKAEVEANGDNPTAEELESIKQQNVNFVKEMEQYKVALTEAIEERDQARRELLGERAFSGKILRYVAEIQKSAKSNLNNLVSGSNHIGEIIKATNAIHHMTNKEKTIHADSINAANSPSKTQVVNPMIAGHVILRPIINLQRVNEISSEEIRRLSNPHIQMNNANLVNDYTNTNEEPSSPGSSNQSSRSGVIRHAGGDNPILEFKFEEEPRRSLENEFEQNDGLGTIMEGSQESGELASNILELSRPGCSRQPLLSGVFHDVRMYVSSVPEMSEMNINTQRGSSTKSVKLTKSPNMTSKSSNKLSNRKKSCMQSNVSVLDENFDFSTPVLSSTRLNASNLMMTEPRPSTSFRHDDDLASTPIDMGQTEPELRVKRVTFNHVDMVTHRGKRIKTNNNSVQNIETILQSPDSCSKTPDESDQLNTTTQFNDLSTNKTALQNLESLPGTPTSSKIDMPSSSETSHVRVLESKNVVKSTTEDKAVSVPKTRSRPKAKKTFSNTPALPIKRITRSKYRRPIKHVDSIYTGSKSDQSRKSDSKRSESLGNNQNSDVSKSPASVSKNQTSVSKNQRSVSKNQRSVSKNQTNASKNQSNITNDESSVSNNTIKSENVSKISSQSVNDTNASTKNRRIGKRKVQELSSETLTASPRKRRGTKEVSLKEPSLRKKMRR